MISSWSLDDTWIVVTGVLCAVAAALPGNFLVLRRMSMLGDAISHAVLPGLAAAFLVGGDRGGVVTIGAAVAVGIVTTLLTHWVRSSGRVDEGAAMGVVFTTLFALGLVMIVRAADDVDLDAGCVLYGAIELTPLDTADVGGWEVPRAAVTLAVVAAVNALLVVVCFKELKLTSFDPALATGQGYSATAMHYALMVGVAVTAVASFEAVGNILVVAMMIVPPAAAFLLTRRLSVMITLSVVIAAAGAAGGHVAAIVVPGWFGMPATTTAGMMAACVGGLFFLALVFSPGQGVVPRVVRKVKLSVGIVADDVVGLLYRREEQSLAPEISAGDLSAELSASPLMTRAALSRGRRKGWVVRRGGVYALTDRGRRRARLLVRSHRLWETYLVERADIDSSRIHPMAERYEHFTDTRLRDELAQSTAADVDPHGSEIPRE